MAGGTMKTVNLNYKDGGWTFDPDELRSALASGKTKVLILNNPHNPTGKIFTLQELETIS
jgi:aspartate/methionine/tyrosine aminotransferase